MRTDLISRSKLHKSLQREEIKVVEGLQYLRADVVLAKISMAPSMDAVPVVHGRWDKPIEHGLPYAANHLGVVCSNCCKWSDNDYNYCPNCGAKMDAKDMDVPTKDGGASDG